MAKFVELEKAEGGRCYINPDLVIALLDEGDHTSIRFAGTDIFVLTVIGNIRKISHKLQNVI